MDAVNKMRPCHGSGTRWVGANLILPVLSCLPPAPSPPPFSTYMWVIYQPSTVLPFLYTFLHYLLHLSCHYSYLDASLSNHSFDFISVQVMLCELIQLCLMFLVEVLPVRICCTISQHFHISGHTCIAYSVFIVPMRFSQCWCWRYRWFGMWCCVPGQIVLDCFKGSYCLHHGGEAAWPWRYKHYGPFWNI